MSQLPDWMLWAVLGVVAALVIAGSGLMGYSAGVNSTVKGRKGQP